MKNSITHSVKGKIVSEAEFDKAFSIDSIIKGEQASLLNIMENIENLYCAKHNTHPKLIEKDGKACVETCCEEVNIPGLTPGA